MANRIVLNETSYHGSGAIKEIVNEVKGRNLKKAFVCSDPDLIKFNVTTKVTNILEESNLEYEIYSNIKPNPTIENVQNGVNAYKKSNADYIIAIGGGSSIDTAKAIGIIINNPEFEDVRSLEGVAPTKNKCVPIIAVPTTAGTAAEVTINYVITDAEKNRKFVCVDTNDIPVVAIVDPDMMESMPKGLTAATGMDALTHAIEAYVSTAATPVTDACAQKAIELIQQYLRDAVADGNNMEARDKMAYAEFLAGMAFNNASLGYVHAIAHQFGGFYNLPHGVCNAILLPAVQEFNAKVASPQLKDCAKFMGVDVSGMSDEEGAAACIAAIRKLAADVNIPKGFAELGAKEEDFDILATNALKDACGATNPIQATHEEIKAILAKVM